MMMKLHTKIGRAGILSLAALILLLGATGIFEILRQNTAHALSDQWAAHRWEKNGYAQISGYFPPGAGDVPGRIYSLTAAVDKALQDASLSAADGGRLWYCAYSGETDMYARTERDAANVRVTVFGGEYFYIHTPELISGSYLSPGGENAGYVFLDEVAAWKLFGALNVVGMPLTLGDGQYTVCGVGRIPRGTVCDEAYGEMPRAYILFDSPAVSGAERISVYEAVLPDPVSGFARDLFKTHFAPGENVVVVENSARFALPAMWEYITHMDTMGMRTSPVVYPWWENVAQVAQYRCACFLTVQIVLVSLALLLCLVWLGIAWKPTMDAIGRGFRMGREWTEDTYNRLTRSKHTSE